MASPILEFNYDISCPFAYIASTRVRALAQRTNATLIYRPVLLGAIYRATAAPQGAAGSASDVYNPTKRAVTGVSMGRTLKRYRIDYNPPPQHPRKSVDALRLLYCVPDGEDRRILTENLFRAYWADGLDVTDRSVLLNIAKKSGIDSAGSLNLDSFADSTARKELETETARTIERGAFGVPGFWAPDVVWKDWKGEERIGRFWWGQDRMHFVEVSLLAHASSSTAQSPASWSSVPNLRSLVPRSIASNSIHGKTRLEFWFDFSSPWAFLGYTQLARFQRVFPGLEVIMKPFLLGILFREIGAPMLPSSVISEAKAKWARQDHADWVGWWNAVNENDARRDKVIDFHWADKFPIRTPTVLRVAIVEPKTTSLLYSACWERNEDVADEAVLSKVLGEGGFNGTDLIARANAPAIKSALRDLTAEAKAKGICGVPTYRVLRQNPKGDWDLVSGLVWGQDEINVVGDLIAGWDPESPDQSHLAEVGKVEYGRNTKL